MALMLLSVCCSVLMGPITSSKIAEGREEAAFSVYVGSIIMLLYKLYPGLFLKILKTIYECTRMAGTLCLLSATPNSRGWRREKHTGEK